MATKRRNRAGRTSQSLRRRAERRLESTGQDIAAMPVQDVQRLVYELQVHQLQLEMQNEELNRAQIELATIRDRYADLYDFAPVGYLTLNSHGVKIIDKIAATEVITTVSQRN